MGSELSIDETALSQGELYTILTNKKAKGKSGSIVAIIAGTQAEVIIKVLHKISRRVRYKVTEITLDMANSMKLIVSTCFPKAIQVTDRFHVQRLALDGLQDIRIKHRWKAIDLENAAILTARNTNKPYQEKLMANGDTKRQLLARSRYLLYKRQIKWTNNQIERSKILFEEYPDIKIAYDLVQSLTRIFDQKLEIEVAYTKLAHWYNKVELAGFKAFNTISRTIQLNYRTILNYFLNRSTNASAESFNAKVKAFRAQFRGVRNIEFFLFRLTNIYA